jgi:hypothetical protein
MSFFRIDDLTEKSFSEFWQFIETVFRGTPTEKLNLEDVITYLELNMDKFSSFGERPDTYVYDAREQFNRYVRMRLDYAPVDDRLWCQKFKKIFSKV